MLRIAVLRFDLLLVFENLGVKSELSKVGGAVANMDAAGSVCGDAAFVGTLSVSYSVVLLAANEDAVFFVLLSVANVDGAVGT